jgi:mRNA-degrading endonuclease RelE of RelBE toxin-antitoxin system
MPIRAIEFHPLARRELKKAERGYRRYSSRTVQRFLQAVDEMLQRIATNAELGSPYRQRFRWMQLKRYPYILYYEVRDPLPVLIYANAHARRRLGYWLRRARP